MKKLFCILIALLISVVLCLSACSADKKTERISAAEETAGETAAMSETDAERAAGIALTTAAAETEETEKEAPAVAESISDVPETEKLSETVPHEEPDGETGAATEEKKDEDRFLSVQEAMASMSTEEKVGQLFVVMPEALQPDIVKCRLSQSDVGNILSVSAEMEEIYKKYPAGGFILFGGNISSSEQLKDFTFQLHALGKIRPFVYIDEEGGSVARIGNSDVISVKKFGNMQGIAESGNTDKAYELGSSIGGYLKEYGIDLDFAPVADVNTNPDNPVIGKRAFGSDPALAGKMVAEVIRGLHSEGVGSCIKHFPGHGDTKTDTHKAYAETLKNWGEIRECEMLPFISGINAGTDMVMVAHIAAPNVTGSGLPATLSHELVTEKLRRELGFQGVIITDSMSMAAVSAQYSPAEAAVKAFQAGVDIILIPDNYAEAFTAILDAVNSGEIPEARLNESVLRILKMKSK